MFYPESIFLNKQSMSHNTDSTRNMLATSLPKAFTAQDVSKQSKVKIKFALEQAMKAQRRNSGIVLLFL
jgi:hypothetical protein